MTASTPAPAQHHPDLFVQHVLQGALRPEWDDGLRKARGGEADGGRQNRTTQVKGDSTHTEM